MHKVYIGKECITLADDRELDLFCAPYHQIVAAGGLVENPAGECLMIFRRNCWDLPKGKQEPGEDTVTCALREVSEETGLNDLTAGSLICVTHHCYIFQNVECIKHTWWYRMQSKNSQKLVPQAEEQIEEAVWVPREKLPVKLANTYPSIREVFFKAYNG
ncbi:MAG: NUDIX domain-containing protein [Bacteroidales bacterium]|nr:NUDIX domain-containing protein [Bacteroidales bacterium]